MSRFITNFSVLFFSIFVSSSISVFAQAPQITGQPSQILECAETEAILKVVVTGAEPFTYQWYQDGNPLSINASEIPFASLTPANSGEYYCNISNAEGNIDSELIPVIVVESAPVINSVTTQKDLVCLGTDNRIEVDYNGQQSHVTWYFQSAVVGYTYLFNITNAELSDEGSYYCVVTNVCGNDTSDTIGIDIVSPVNIVTQPTTQVICLGEDAQFNPVAEGDYLNYIWLADNEMITGQTDSTLTINAPTNPHQVGYNFVAYNVCNSDTSNVVFVSVKTLPLISASPNDHQVCLGESVTLNATATANSPITYQWYDEDNEIIDGATETSLDIELAANDIAHYYCVFSNMCGTVNSDIAEIITRMPPEITQQPVGGVFCVGDDVSMSVKAVGATPIYYQWLFNEIDVSGSNISGDETPIVEISSITQAQQGTYTCHVNNSCGSTISDEAIVTINTPPLVTEQPEGIELCAEEELSITFNHSGTQPITFEWMMMGSENPVGTEADYYSASAEATNSGAYYCLLSNDCAVVSTDIIEVEILALPQITTHPDDESVCVGEYASMEIEAEGAEPLDFLWYRNASATSGQTNSLLEYSPAQVNQSGEYFCRVTNVCGYDDSGTAILTIGTEPAITWHPVAQTICANDTLSLRMDAQGENYTLQWYFNGTPLPGENDTALNIINVSVSMAGMYYCSAFNTCAIANSDTVEVVIHPAPDMSLGNDIDLCAGETISIGPVGDYTHYTWNNGLSNTPNLDVHLPGTYILEVTGENSCKNRDTLIVAYHPYHQILFDDTEIISCGPYVLDAGEGGYGYTWNTGPVQTTSSIVITEPGTYSVTVTGDAYGCSTSQAAYVDIREPVSINLGEDKVVPVSSYVDIGIAEEFAQYIWNTDYTGPILTVYGSNYGLGEHEFWLTVIAQNECMASDTITVVFWDDLGVEDAKNTGGILIYPNPAKDYLTISEISHNIENIEIISVTGQVIKSFSVNSNEITLNLTNFAEGIYFVKIKRNNEILTKKIIIR